MWCVRCDNDFTFCLCEDADERLRKLRDHPNLLIPWCERCDHAVSRCVCGEVN